MTVEVTSARVTASNTVVEFRIVSPTTLTVTSDLQYALAGKALSTRVMAGITLRVPSLGDRTYHLPYHLENLYTASLIPDRIGPEPYFGFAHFGPLPEGVSSAELRIPGIAPISVPISRG